MSKFEKALQKLLNPTTIISYRELNYILIKLGYEEKSTGKSSGSRKAYIHTTTKHIIRIHKPHPGNEIKAYVKKYIKYELKKNNLL